MYNIFVFPLEILLNLIVLFLDKSWIFSKKNPPQDGMLHVLRRF